jgi:excisionase family DNA binding protein
MSNSLLTTKEVADLLEVSRATVQRLAESGELPCIRKLEGKGGRMFDATVVQVFARKYAPQRQRQAKAS